MAYTLIAIIEVNLSYYYNPLYWQTACLTVNSGSLEVDEYTKSKNTNYGKVAEAIGKLKSHNVKLASPEINLAEFGFIPDIENERIIYSLKGIVGISDEVVYEIIENRPYKSFKDFYTRLHKEKGLVKRTHVIQLIKAGAFNEFDRADKIMQEFVEYDADIKTSLDFKNLSSIIKLGMLDSPQLSKFKKAFFFRDYAKKHKRNFLEHEESPYKNDKVLVLKGDAVKFYNNVFDNIIDSTAVLGYNGEALEISEKLFEKEYSAFMQPLRELLKTGGFVTHYNNQLKNNIMQSVGEGTVEKWEMDSVSFYSDKHELYPVDNEFYGIVNFFELDEAPVIESYFKYNGKEIPKHQIFTIAGTVLDRNKDKHTFSLLTEFGVVTCKTYSGSFSHYDKAVSQRLPNGKKKIIESSWFSRGNKVLVQGFRRGEQFMLKTYKTKGNNVKTVNLITEIGEEGKISIRSERLQG